MMTDLLITFREVRTIVERDFGIMREFFFSQLFMNVADFKFLNR